MQPCWLPTSLGSREKNKTLNVLYANTSWIAKAKGFTRQPGRPDSWVASATLTSSPYLWLPFCHPQPRQRKRIRPATLRR